MAVWPVAFVLALLAASASAAPCRMQDGAQHEWCGLPYELSNFQGHHKCNSSVILGRPRTYSELSQLVKAYPKVKASGVGHSWWTEQFCAGTNSSSINVLTTEFDAVLGAVRARDLSSVITVNEADMTVTTPAGLTQRAVLEHLANYRTPKSPEGYTLGSFSWFIDQTIGGAVATGSHGSSFLYGSLSSQLRAIKFMDATGAVCVATSTRDPHLWRALTVNVGRLGIILELTFRIVRNQNIHRSKQDVSMDGFLAQLRRLQNDYNVAKGGAGTHVTPDTSAKVWNVLRPWNDAQVFWHVPLRDTWMVTFQRFDNSTQAAPPVTALDGPPAAALAMAAGAPQPSRMGVIGGSEGLPPGAYHQKRVVPVGYAPGIERGAVAWAGMYATWLSINVQPETLPARRAFLSLSEMENVLYSPYNSYDQYEVGVPLSRGADCLEALSKEVYGPRALFQGFRVPALIRFVAGETSYLSPSNGGPVLYMNLEDHVSYATGRTNTEFQAVMTFLRRDPACRGRMHWGKAGWAVHAKNFDGAAEYGDGWCHFGCAVRQLDPTGKFSSASDVWRWAAAERRGGGALDFESCCSASGFDTARCACARRQ